MIGVLTLQGIRAARQQEFSGFSGLGDANSGQALRGSVIDVVINVGDANRVFFYDTALLNSLRDNLNANGFQVINIDGSNLGSFGGGGTIRIRAQINSDGYNSAADAASVIAGAASALGYNATSSTGLLVSTPQAGTVGGSSGQTQTGQNYANPIVASSANPLTNFFSNLTESPITLALILGAAVFLVIAAKK